MCDNIRQQAYYFFDYRHIRCGDLEWRSPNGEPLPVAGPPGEAVEAIADPVYVARGIRLAAQPARKTDPLPADTKRGSRVIYENSIYRSWSIKVAYPTGKDLGSYSSAQVEKVEIVYSESDDGFDWAEKARSPITPYGVSGFDGFTVFIDPHGAPTERYKAVFMASAPPEQHAALMVEYDKLHSRHQDVRIVQRRKPTCLYAAVSPDGLHWEALPEPLMIHYSDTDTTVFFDAWLGKYVMYTRLYPYDRRVIARAEADDYHHWGPVSPLIWPGLDSPNTDIYLNAYSTYPGAPEYRLMFPMFYTRDDQRSTVRLFSSADGLVWNQVPGGPVITPGKRGAWDSEFIHAGKDLVPLGAGRVAVPYAGTPYPHKYPRWPQVLAAGRGAWAWWSEGRLCAVTADDEGSFITMPIFPAGRALSLNARTTRAGEIRVGILDAPGRTLADCTPIEGDGAALPVHWHGQDDIGVPDDQPVILQFRMRHAELFGFSWY